MIMSLAGVDRMKNKKKMQEMATTHGANHKGDITRVLTCQVTTPNEYR